VNVLVWVIVRVGV
jgi:hypothetical protein